MAIGISSSSECVCVHPLQSLILIIISTKHKVSVCNLIYVGVLELGRMPHHSVYSFIHSFSMYKYLADIIHFLQLSTSWVSTDPKDLPEGHHVGSMTVPWPPPYYVKVSYIVLWSCCL